MSHLTKRKRDDHLSDNADDEESDSQEEFEFENIDLQSLAWSDSKAATRMGTKDKPIQVAIEVKTVELPSSTLYPKAVLARKIRLEIHKVHLLCLLSHTSIRHKWCAEPAVVHALERIKPRIKGNIHPKRTSAQMQRTRVLRQSLEMISDIWSKTYKIIKIGLVGAKWYTEAGVIGSRADSAVRDKDETALTRASFIEAAKRLEGDRDTGAQLFVTFLRLLGFEARLICSLQPLSLHAVKLSLSNDRANEERAKLRVTDDLSSTGAANPVRGRRLMRPQLGSRNPSAVVRPKAHVQSTMLEHELRYPTYWAEVFDEACQKWYAMDPLITGVIDAPSAFEPPQSEAQISFAYVVALNQDGSAKDVTKRYTSQFNAKVRRRRLESISQSAADWWARVLKYYRPKVNRDRDAIEDAELAQKSLTEGIPANIADLKNHPLFVIERHLRKQEIILPLRECGSVRVAKGQDVEKVYPRKYVQRLKSQRAWYMQGRQVVTDAVALKKVPLKGDSNLTNQADSSETHAQYEELFSEAQTEVYVAPPVVDGKIPKNAFGNIDLFVPSMLPSGASHLLEREAESAAKLLMIDYAVAITAFEFSNRQSLPVKQGIVVADEYCSAMVEVIAALQDERQSEAGRKAALAALERWSRYLRALRIRVHVESMYGGVDEHKMNEGAEQLPDTGGGFL